MKKCQEEGCEAQINDNYSFCYEHYKTGKRTDMAAKGSWHADPVVDALLKINANLGRILQVIEKRPPVKLDDAAKTDDFFD